MGTRIVLAMYRPNEGKEDDLLELIRQHLPTLREYELATDRPALLLRGEDGTYIEIFEWVSDSAAGEAHEHPAIARIWEQMGVVGEFRTLGALPEASRTFPHFTPVTI